MMTAPHRHLGQMFKAPLVCEECSGPGCGVASALCSLSTSALRATVALCQCCADVQEAAVVVTRGTAQLLSAVLLLNRWMWCVLSVAEAPRQSSTEQMNSIPRSLTNQTTVTKTRERHGHPSLLQLQGVIRRLRECALGALPVFGQCCLSMWAAILALGGCIKPVLVFLWILSSYARTIILSIRALHGSKESETWH